MPHEGNYDLTNLVTPLNVGEFKRLLLQTGYNHRETAYLIDGFTYGFDLQYKGTYKRQDTSKKLPIREGVRSEKELWGKMIKEIQAKRFAGPFNNIPFEYYVQSPVGLVPKANGQTRLIFHLSYDFKEGKSINHHIPAELCTVKYCDLDHALLQCLNLLKDDPTQKIYFGICDIKSAFRLVPLKNGVGAY